VTLAHLAHETLLLARQRDNVLTIKVICVYDTANVDRCRYGLLLAHGAGGVGGCLGVRGREGRETARPRRVVGIFIPRARVFVPSRDTVASHRESCLAFLL